MRRILQAVITALFLLPVATHAASPDAASIAKQGLGDKVVACSSCHDADGGGNTAAGFPRLAGLDRTYLVDQLNAFASGQRANPVMMPIARAMSDEQRRAMADYYSQLPVPPAQSAGTDTGNIPAAGTALAEHGRWADGIPACVQCHGPAGVGVGEHFPPLAGQPAGYIEAQLRAWRTGKRPGGPMGLMASIASRLHDDDLAPVAAYFAAQTPATHKTEGDEHE